MSPSVTTSGALLHHHRGDRGHRRDAGDIDLGQLLHEGQHGVELALEVLDLVVRHGNPRQTGDLADGCGIDGHTLRFLRLSPTRYSRRAFAAATGKTRRTDGTPDALAGCSQGRLTAADAVPCRQSAL